MTEQRIVEKLRKLVEHERSARGIGNLEEAEAFAAKIQELLLPPAIAHAWLHGACGVQVSTIAK